MLLLNRVRKYALVANFQVHFLRRKRCFSGGTDTSGGLETLRQLSGLLTDGGRRKKRDVDFTTPKHSGILPAWSTVFRESSIELGSVAPFSVVNPEDAVQIIGGRPVIGSERIRRHARRKARETRPRQRLICFSPLSRHKCLPVSSGAGFPARNADILVGASRPFHSRFGPPLGCASAAQVGQALSPANSAPTQPRTRLLI